MGPRLRATDRQGPNPSPRAAGKAPCGEGKFIDGLGI